MAAVPIVLAGEEIVKAAAVCTGALGGAMLLTKTAERAAESFSPPARSEAAEREVPTTPPRTDALPRTNTGKSIGRDNVIGAH
jgi:hypothetical protein